MNGLPESLTLLGYNVFLYLSHVHRNKSLVPHTQTHYPPTHTHTQTIGGVLEQHNVTLIDTLSCNTTLSGVLCPCVLKQSCLRPWGTHNKTFYIVGLKQVVPLSISVNWDVHNALTYIEINLGHKGYILTGVDWSIFSQRFATCMWIDTFNQYINWCVNRLLI